MGHIVDKAMKELSEQLAERDTSIELSEAARNHLAEVGYDRDNGARPLGRVVQDLIKRPLGDELLFGKLESGGHVVVDVRDGKIVFDFDPVSRVPKRPSNTPKDMLN
jgi:ATP-dependent Clp protease ATP-binding subunit ClpA